MTNFRNEILTDSIVKELDLRNVHNIASFHLQSCELPHITVNVYYLILTVNFDTNEITPGASILGAWGDTSPPIFRLGGRISNCPPHFFICSMKFNSKLFSVHCGHCLSLNILLNIIQIQTRSHMLTQSCFFSNFLRCY